MTQPPSGDQPQYGAQPPQYGGGQPPQYGSGQPPQYGSQPGYGGGEGEPPKNKKTGLIIGLVVLAVIVIGIVIIALGTLRGSSSCGTSGDSFCDRFEKNAKSNQFDNIDPADTDKLINELETFKDLAPEELKDDYDQLIDAANGNPGANVDTAVQNIQNYAVDNCDVQLDTPPS